MKVFAQFLSLAALCIIATGCFPYHATTRMGVSGTVTDAETHAPVGGAVVSFAGSQSGTTVATSADDGSFTLAPHRQWQLRFINGDYFTDRLIGGSLRVYHPGYETNTLEVVAYDAQHHYHTEARLGTILLKPLAKTR